MNRPKRWLLLMVAALMFAVGSQAGAQQERSKELWLLIEDRAATLTVYRGDQVIERFHPISLGRGGASRLRISGDGKTPLGEFHINWIDRSSRFHIFLGLDYPTVDNAREAMEAGVMTPAQYVDYRFYVQEHGVPPQNTVLGGHIGIHGIGNGDPWVHEHFNWTEGCVAVTNAQIDTLADMISLGTRVVIRP